MKRSSIAKMKWKVAPYRKDKRTGAISPIRRSEYLKDLFEKGADWNAGTRNKLGR